MTRLALPLPLALALALALAIGCGGAKPAPEAVEGPTDAPAATRGAPEPAVQLIRVPAAADIVDLRVVFEAGSAYDPAGKQGAAWLLAHAMAEGGTRDLTYAQLTERLHPWAASIGVQIDKELVTFHARCHRDHVDAFAPLFVDVLLRPRMAASDIERLRARALAQLTGEVRSSNAEELAKTVLESLIFEGHPYAHPELGTEAGLSALSREDLLAHAREVLVQRRLYVGLGGPEEVIGPLGERLREAFATLPLGQEAPALPAPPPPRRRLVIVEQGTPGTALALGHAIDVRRGHAAFPALELATSYLGEHRLFYGVLFQSIREARGMNYGDYAYAEAFRQEGWGRFPLTNIARRHQHYSVWLRPVPNEDRLFALRIALWNLDRVLKAGLSPEDFERTRRFKSGYVLLGAQTLMRRVGGAIDDAFYGLDRPHAEGLRAAFEGLDAAAVSETLRQVLRPSQLTMVIVTPDAAALREQILAGAPSPKRYASPKPEAILAEDKIIEAWPLGLEAADVTVVPSDSLFAK